MKTMTCKDMGGPCDAAMTASTQEEMMQKGKGHVTGVADDAHKKIAEDMKTMTPEREAAWHEEFTKNWNATPDSV